MTTVSLEALESMQHYDIIKNPRDLLRVAEEEIVRCRWCGFDDAVNEDETCRDCKNVDLELEKGE